MYYKIITIPWFCDLLCQEKVGEYDTDVYNITNLILIARRRSEVFVKWWGGEREEGEGRKGGRRWGTLRSVTVSCMTVVYFIQERTSDT